MAIKKRELALCLLLMTILSGLLTVSWSHAETGSLVLKAEQHWDTYGVNGTCIAGSNNLFIGNVDGDQGIEVLTGGSSYGLYPNGTTTSREAPLRIWSWNGEKTTLEFKRNWAGNINSVYGADVDGDGKVELFTSGTTRNENGSYSPSIKIWNYDDSSLTLKQNVEGIATTAIFASDLNHDGKREIVSIGRYNISDEYGARLYVWRSGKNSFEIESSVQWCITNVTSVGSVFAEDLNDDGKIEIVTGGYAYQLRNSSGQLRIWQYEGSTFTLKASEEWRLVENVYALTIAGGIQGNTAVNNLKVGDVDSDGTPEIVTGGFAYDGENVNAQLRIWSWNGEKLILEKSKEWTTDYITEIKCVSLGDVDGDSKLEIVTSGMVGAEGSFANNATTSNMAQLMVWSWTGTEITLEHGKDWTLGDGVCAWNVGTGDLDGNGVTEIVTLGCMGESTLCDPDMRIWSVSSDNALPVIYVVTAGLCITAALAGAFLWTKRRAR